MYLKYGPCTQAAIFFKHDIFPGLVDGINDSLGIINRRRHPIRSSLLHSSKDQLILKDGSREYSEYGKYRGSDDDDETNDNESGWLYLRNLQWPSVQDVDFDIVVSVIVNRVLLIEEHLDIIVDAISP